MFQLSQKVTFNTYFPICRICSETQSEFWFFSTTACRVETLLSPPQSPYGFINVSQNVPLTQKAQVNFKCNYHGSQKSDSPSCCQSQEFNTEGKTWPRVHHLSPPASLCHNNLINKCSKSTINSFSIWFFLELVKP